MLLDDAILSFGHHWRIVSILTLVGVAGGWGGSLLVEPTYQARADVLITVTAEGTNAPAAGESRLLARRAAQNYTPLIQSAPILQAVIENAEVEETPDELAEQLGAYIVGSSIVRVTASDSTNTGATSIAEEAASALKNEIESTPSSVADGFLLHGDVSFYPASTAESTPNIPLNTAVGLVLGASAGMALALARSGRASYRPKHGRGRG